MSSARHRRGPRAWPTREDRPRDPVTVPCARERYLRVVTDVRVDVESFAGEREAGRAPALRCAVILNAAAGGARGDDTADRVRAALEKAGMSPTVLRARGAEISDVARRAASDPAFSAVVAAGGDGTVSAVAGALAGTDKALAVLPMGTLNHFAKDLGVPLALDAAARAIASGVPRAIDVAEANGRVFVNNSSLGLYPRAVRERERLRARLGRLASKWLAMSWAMLLVLVRLRPLTVRIRWGGGGGSRRRTPFVFVGNNRYDAALLATQWRAALDRGLLGVYVARERTRVGLLRLALRALLRRLHDRDLDALDVPSLTIESHRRRLLVSVDGEVVPLATPIRYRIRPGALRVLAPPVARPAS
jgi:diacylglycerol kinase family enzyme